MIERLEAIEKRYNAIGEELANPEVISDIKKLTVLSKERTSLEKTVIVYRDYKKFFQILKKLKNYCTIKIWQNLLKKNFFEQKKKKRD